MTADAPVLLIVSHTPHHRSGEQVVGLESTVTEIDQLATLFARVRHVAPLHDGPAPPGAIAYRADNVEFLAVTPAGGNTAMAKLGILRQAPTWMRTVARFRRTADVTHIRAPANIALAALLMPRRGPRWIKYAGDWSAAGSPRTYRLQRQLARRRRPDSVTTVNGRLDADHAGIVSFDNPSLTDDDIAAGRLAAGSCSLDDPLRLVFAGRLESAKGPLIAIDAVADLRRRGVDARLTLVGDGPQQSECRQRASDVALGESVTVTGPLPRDEVLRLFAEAQFTLLPSRSEGWPKVLSEAMAFGSVPIAAAVSCIPEVLADIGCGSVCPNTGTAIADAVEAYLDDPRRWNNERDRGAAASDRFGYRVHVERVRALVADLAPELALGPR